MLRELVCYEKENGGNKIGGYMYISCKPDVTGVSLLQRKVEKE